MTAYERPRVAEFPSGLGWRRRASCVPHPTPSLWFNGHEAAIAEARAICNDCPVRRTCLASQLDYERQVGFATDGMFGGRTPAERRVVLNRRRRF